MCCSSFRAGIATIALQFVNSASRRSASKMGRYLRSTRAWLQKCASSHVSKVRSIILNDVWNDSFHSHFFVVHGLAALGFPFVSANRPIDRPNILNPARKYSLYSWSSLIFLFYIVRMRTMAETQLQNMRS